MGLGKSTSPSNPGNTNYATSTSTQTPPSYLNTAYQGLVGRASNQAAQPYQPYTGGFEADQTQGRQRIGQWADPNNTSASRVGQYMSPYNDAVVQATMANMQEQNAQQQQGVIGDAIAKGAMGGNRVGVAQGELARQQNLANQQTIAGLHNQNYSQALGAAQADKAYGLQSAESQLGAGTQQQQFNYSQYLNQQGFPYAQGSWLNSMLGSVGPYAGGQTDSTAPEGNAMSGLLGGVTSLLGFLSDERAKTDIQHIGKTFDGQPIYSYRMKGDPRTSMGLLAQDVKQSHPEAIGHRNDGLMTVDYGKATRGAADRGHFAGGGLVPYNANGMYGSPAFSGENLWSSYISDNGSPSGSAAAVYPDAPEIKYDDGQSPSDMASNFSNMQGAGYRFGQNISGQHGYIPGMTGPSLYAAGGEVRPEYAPGGLVPQVWLPSYVQRKEEEQAPPPPAPLPPVTQAMFDANFAGGADPTPQIDPGLMGLAPTDAVPSPTLDDVGYQGDISTDGLVPSSYADPTGPMDVQQMDPNASLVPNASPPVGQMPQGTGQGPAFQTQYDPNYPQGGDIGQNLGNAWNSLIHGGGLNPSPANQGLMAAGFGMMASHAPFLQGGIGEGGLAGIKTWNERQALERENALARSKVAYDQGSLAQAGQRLWVDTQTAAANIGNVQMQTQQMRYPRTPGLTGDVVKDIADPYAPGKVVPYDMGQGAGTNASDIPTAPAEIGTPHPIIDDVGNVSFKPQPPANIRMNPEGYNDVGKQLITERSAAAEKKAADNYTIAKNMGVNIALMKEAASKLPATGILAQGPGLTERAGIVRNLNAIYSMLGIKNQDGSLYQIDPEAVANVEELNKFTTRLGFDLGSTTSSDVASSVIQQAIAAVPGVENSPQGFPLIVASIQAGLNRQSDYYEFMQKWRSQTGGDITGMDEYFNDHYPPQLYAKYALATAYAIVPKSQEEVDGAPSGTVFNINGQIFTVP